MNENRIKTVSVIGCGHMGWIFGFHCAVYGYPIKFYDVNQAAIDKAEQLITDELDSRVKQQQFVSQFIEFANDVRAGEPGPTNHQDSHGCCSFPFFHIFLNRPCREWIKPVDGLIKQKICGIMQNC